MAIISVTVASTSSTSTTTPNGTVTSTVTGETAPFTYLWSSGETMSSITGKAAGTYTLTVTDSTGATGTAIGSVVSTPLLQRYSFDGTLAASGSLALAPVGVSTTLGTPAFTTGPMTGMQALVIPTFSSYLTLPFNSSLDFGRGAPFSCGGWYYMSTITEPPMYLSNLSPGTKGIEFYTDSGTTVLVLRIMTPPSGQILSTAGKTSQINKWVHVWLTYDTVQFKMYIGGVLSFAVNDSGNEFASGLPWNICHSQRNSVGQWSMTGAIADIRWYSGEVTAVTAMTAMANPLGVAVVTTDSTSSITPNGTITATASNGTSPFTYLWSSGETTSTISGKAGGSYTVTVTDSKSATVSATAIVVSTPLLQQFTFNGTLAASGSLALAPVGISSTLGTPTYTTGPIAGMKALVIPTFSSYLTLPFNPSLDFGQGTPFSCGGWYYMATTTDPPFYLTNTGSEATKGIEIYVDSGTTLLVLRISLAPSGQASATAGKTSQINKWAHTWLTYDTSTFKLYIDGILSITVTNPVYEFASGLPWYICHSQRNSVGQWSMTGAIADVRWYSGVVTPTVAMTQIGQTTTYAMSLDGTYAKFLSMATPIPIASAFTVEMWIYPKGLTYYDRLYEIFDTFGGYTGKYQACFNVGTDNLFVRYNSTYRVTTSSFPLNTWTHLAITCTSSGLLTIYKNGSIIDTLSTTPLPAKSYSNFWFGKSVQSDNTSSNLNGNLTEIRVWSVARDSASIMENYNKSLTSDPTLQFNISSAKLQSMPSSGILNLENNNIMTYNSYTVGSIVQTTALQLSAPTAADPNALQLTISSTDTTGTTGTASVVAYGGTGSYVYSWTKNGTTISGATTATITGLSTGTYVCTVTSGIYSGTVTAILAGGLQFTATAPTFFTMQWPAVTNASSYTVYYSTINASVGFFPYIDMLSVLNATVSNITPAQTYYVQIKSKLNGAPTTSYTGSVTLPANAATSYNKGKIPVTFITQGLPAVATVYDVSTIPASSGGVTRDAIISSAFKTGDLISVLGTIPHAAKLVKSAQVLNPTETITTAVPKNGAVYLPTATAGQISNLTLTNKTVQPITVNANSVVVNGVTYTVGSTFMLDGQNVTVELA